MDALRFQGWELRPVQRVLLVRGQAADVGSRALEVLLALAERQGRVVSRRELLDTVWHDLVVEENNLSVQIGTLRKLLGRDAIATIPGLGYRLTALPLDAPSALPSQPPADLAPPPPAAHAPGNLPAVLPTLFGRAADISRLATMVRQHRLVSVIGTGGMGKTRLAQAVGHALAADFPGGVWMVELAPLTDAALLPAAVAQALGARLPGSPTALQQTSLEQVVEAIRDAQVLLVLDNCEHLVEAAARFAQAVLERALHARLLVTSQAILKLSGEHVYRPPPLSVPAADDVAAFADHGAVQLLATRVRALAPHFDIDQTNAADAVEICRRLDGLPLAIELAAARVPLLGLAGVRERLNERFRMLTAGRRAEPQRQHTLRETMAWSHALLTADERAVFRRASVFAGSFGLLHAERVLGDGQIDAWDVLDLLGELVNKSLVVVEGADPPRYRLLESARLYAGERLLEVGEQADTLRRHAQLLAELFETSLAQQWLMPSQVRLQRYLPDLDNGRAALAWAWIHDKAAYVAMAGTLAWLFGASGQAAEGRQHCNDALQAVGPDTPPRAVARLHFELAALAHHQADPDKLASARQAVLLYRGIGDAAALYSALGRLAITAAICNDGPAGDAATQEMARLWDPKWPPLARWELLNARDFVANLMHRMDDGEALAAEQLALATATGDTYKRLFAMVAMQQCVATRGRYAQAVQLGRELVELAQRERYVEKLHDYVTNLATALVMADELDEAVPAARWAVDLVKPHKVLWQCLDMLAMLAYKRGRPLEAAMVLGCADARNGWRDKNKQFREPVEGKVRDALLLALQSRFPAHDLQCLLASGAALSDEVAATIALGGPAAT